MRSGNGAPSELLSRPSLVLLIWTSMSIIRSFLCEEKVLHEMSKHKPMINARLTAKSRALSSNAFFPSSPRNFKTCSTDFLVTSFIPSHPSTASSLPSAARSCAVSLPTVRATISNFRSLGPSTKLTIAFGALSPCRRPNLCIRVYPPVRSAYRSARVEKSFGMMDLGGSKLSGSVSEGVLGYSRGNRGGGVFTLMKVSGLWWWAGYLN